MEICTVDDIGLELTGPDAPPFIAAMNEYLSTFAKPTAAGNGDEFMFGRTKCLHCDSALDGLLGSFVWGMAAGEGECGICGWPGRAHHNPMIDGEPMFPHAFERVLQYHPSHVAVPNKEEAPVA